MNLLRNFPYHRTLFTFLAITIQLLVLIGVIIKFNDYFAFFYGGSLFISIVAVLWIVNTKANPVYKLAWIIPVLMFPIFGVLFYAFFGGNKLSKREKRRMKCIEDKTRESLGDSPQQILDEISYQNQDAANQSRYIYNYSYYPPYKHTICEYLPLGEIKFARLKEELKKAQHYIFLEYFIIEEGYMWNSILEILKKKAREGVDVRVIYDDIGCLLKLPDDFAQKLEKMGIKCSVFNPLIPLLSPKLNKRDHRKIAIIDGYVGFTGGVNLADEYINKIEKYGHWKDTAIMLKGDAVWSLTVMFLSMWDFIREINEDFYEFKKKYSVDGSIINDGYVQPFADNPLDDEPVGEIVYLNLINKARKYIYITTPYLIIDNEMVTALTSAAKSGVDVRIITPHYADKWYVHQVTRSYYKILVENGVKVYEYTPGFIHSKTFVADDEYGVVGTINMDYRSLFLHFECGVWLYGGNSIIKMKEDFQHTLRMCQEITLEDINNVKWYQTIIGTFLRVFAPLM